MILVLLLALPLCMSFAVAAALAQDHRVLVEGRINFNRLPGARSH
jgi:hypothetical protein